MKAEQLKKIMDFIKKTGQSCLITDFESDDIYVLATLESYEKNVDPIEGDQALTEDALLDRINQDIATWQAKHQGEVENSAGDESVFGVESTVEDDKYYIEPVE